MLTGSEIRRKFLDYFVQHGHREVHSSSLVPHSDPTLLFTNAGMNQFKDVFLGLEKRDYQRATSSQKCVRAGGKHNDLENVGFTNRHHTFFEMLGNFSFGDYFKKDAIAYAWELITAPQWFGIAKDKLYVTVFEGANIPPAEIPRDDESEQFWLAVGVPKQRIFAAGMKDNFWQMGDTGPCGPSSEIHYDMGPAASDRGHTTCAFPCDCGRYVEIWNLVFMQYDRQAGLTNGVPWSAFKLLPKPSIDTGAGLERLAAAMLNLNDPTKVSNYETDLFVPLIRKAADLCRVNVWIPAKIGFGVSDPAKAEAKEERIRASNLLSNPSLRVIADHSRAATFLISDSVLPSNEGRGYVLRKIIRRAITHGRLLGQTQPFLHKMVCAVLDGMKDAYPELLDSADRVMQAVETEEHQFARVVSEGSRRFDLAIAELIQPWVQQYLSQLRSLSAAHSSVVAGGHTGSFEEMLAILQSSQPAVANQFFIKHLRELLKSRLEITFSGSKAFDIFQTFGLPLDFMMDAARDLGMGIGLEEFETARAEEQARARASWKGAPKQTANPAYQKLPTSSFEGYGQSRSDGCQVLAIIKAGQGAQQLHPGEEGEVILDHTPFYAESGGQVGDRGWLYSDDHDTVVAEVKGCYYPVPGVRAHQVIAKQPIRVGDQVEAAVNPEIRRSTMRNHTATHLLHAGLREVLGQHVKQAGSLVAPNHLRFDFSHFTAVEAEELEDIEDLINQEVLRNQKIEVIENVPIDVALNQYKAMALFGEKYGDKVRVVKIGDFSTELCGGTHTDATGEIGLIKVLKEGSVSSGVRRVEAVTGEGSLQHFQQDHKLDEVARSLIPKDAYGAAGVQAARDKTGTEEPSSPRSLPEALLRLIQSREEKISQLQKEIRESRMRMAREAAVKGKAEVRLVRGVKVLATRLDDLDRPQMREMVDKFRTELGSGVVVLGSATNGNVALIVSVTKDLTRRIQAGKVIGPVAERFGGKGGGRPDLAEAGGKNPEALDSALAEVYTVVDSLLGA